MKTVARHPEEEQLLRYLDGELPTRAAGRVRSHLETCWQCRTELEELEGVIGECVRYRKDVLQTQLPAPPEPWFDIRREFAKIDAQPDQISWLERIVRPFRVPLGDPRTWVVTTLSLVVVWGVFYRFHETPSVQAAELLKKATIAEAKSPVHRRIHIRTRSLNFTRVAGSPLQAPVQAMFQTAGYNSENPLSAQSYQAWHDRLADKQDSVIEEENAYRIRTSTTSGELTEASLTLAKHDLHPVKERLEFRNQDWMEISEVTEPEVAPQEMVASARPLAPAEKVEASPETGPSLAPVPLPAATAEDELRVVAALHRIGADLGDPIEVALTGGEILVTGVGIAPNRQQEIREALSANPRAHVEFPEVPPSAQGPSDKPAIAAKGGPASADLVELQNKIAEQIGGRVQFEQVASQVLDLSEPMMSRAYALRRLARQFPVEAEAQLSEPDRGILRKLRQDHTAALRQQAVELDRSLKPIWTALNSRPQGIGFVSGSDDAWQPATEELFQAAKRVDQLLGVLFGASSTRVASKQVPAELQSSLLRLRARLDTYDHQARDTRSEK